VTISATGQKENRIFGEYLLKYKLHVWNSECTRSKLSINSDSTYEFIDCDWSRNDTIIGKCQIESKFIILKEHKGRNIKYYFKNDRIYATRLNRFIKRPMYYKKEE